MIECYVDVAARRVARAACTIRVTTSKPPKTTKLRAPVRQRVFVPFDRAKLTVRLLGASAEVASDIRDRRDFVFAIGTKHAYDDLQDLFVRELERAARFTGTTFDLYQTYGGGWYSALDDSR